MTSQNSRRLISPAPNPQPFRVRIAVAAMVIALAPIAVQTTTLVLTQSNLATAIAAFVLLALILAGGMLGLVRIAGSLRAVSPGAVISLVLAVVTYNLLAFPVAHIINARWFGTGAP